MSRGLDGAKRPAGAPATTGSGQVFPPRKMAPCCHGTCVAKPVQTLPPGGVETTSAVCGAVRRFRTALHVALIVT